MSEKPLRMILLKFLLLYLEHCNLRMSLATNMQYIRSAVQVHTVSRVNSRMSLAFRYTRYMRSAVQIHGDTFRVRVRVIFINKSPNSSTSGPITRLTLYANHEKLLTSTILTFKTTLMDKFVAYICCRFQN